MENKEVKLDWLEEYEAEKYKFTYKSRFLFINNGKSGTLRFLEDEIDLYKKVLRYPFCSIYKLVELPLNQTRNDAECWHENSEESAERAEYERLKAKFEK